MPCAPIRELPLINHCVPCYEFPLVRIRSVGGTAHSQSDALALEEAAIDWLNDHPWEPAAVTEFYNLAVEGWLYSEASGEFVLFPPRVSLSNIDPAHFSRQISCTGTVEVAPIYSVLLTYQRMQVSYRANTGICEQYTVATSGLPGGPTFEGPTYAGQFGRVFDFNRAREKSLSDILLDEASQFNVNQTITWRLSSEIPLPCTAPAP